MSFQDKIFIDKIREKLWSSTEIGKAAVMIGSGFSRNSSLYKKNKFPLWGELKEKLKDELNQRNNISSQGKSPLKLASEYQASLGRQNLEKVIENIIPDFVHEPSKLHKLLLRLPWSDVFTTNYDTLLERGARTTHERKYDIVYSPEDIPQVTKPRIVKLHGSIPSTKPYIITEEDYRTYPFEFAAFVNTVQQSLMENALCLLGFSGEDPNFKQWTGWIRDNLGQSKMPIYLVGILDLQNSERELLINRGIRPVDLSPLFPKENYSNLDIRHYKATKWFLLSLLAGEPPKKSDWPNYISKDFENSDDNFPSVLKSSKSKIIDRKAPKLKEDFSNSDIDNLTSYWVDERNEFPGWVVAPIATQNKIWRTVRDMPRKIRQDYDNIQLKQKILLISETCWRYDLCLFPIWDDFIPFIETFLKQNNPFQELDEMDFIYLTEANISSNGLDLNKFKNRWVSILYTLLKYYKEKHNEEKFLKWLTILGKIKYLDKNWIAKYYYLGSLYALEQLDADKLNTYLSEWPYFYELTEWNLKKASILLEIGEIEEAKKNVSNSLNKIRSQYYESEGDFKLYSEEGIALYLFNLIEQNENFSNSKLKSYWSRWEELRQFKADISEIVKSSKYRLLTRSLEIKPRKVEKQKFDPGKRIESFSYGGLNNIEIQRYSYKYLRLFQEAGIPFTVSNIRVIDYDALSKTHDVLATQEPRWIYANLIRCGNKKLIKNWFDRVRVSKQDDEDTHYLIELLLKAFKQGLESLEKVSIPPRRLDGHIAYKQVKIASQVLSLFSLRTNDEQRKKLFNLILAFYKHPIHQEVHFLHKNVALLFERFFYQKDTITIGELKKLLELKILGESGLELNIKDKWPEPLHFITKVSFNDKKKAQRSIQNAISDLLYLFLKEKNDVRERAFIRLNFLFRNELLKEEDVQKFAEGIWIYTDQYQLPDLGNYYKNYLIALPAPQNINVEKRFGEFLLDYSFNRVINKKINNEGKEVRSMGIGGIDYNAVFMHEILNGTQNFSSFRNKENNNLLSLKPDIYKSVFNNFIQWWEEEKNEILVEEERLSAWTPINQVRERFDRMLPLISCVLIPFSKSKKDLNKLKTLLDEMEELGINTLLAYPALHFKGLKSNISLSQKIRSDLNSSSKESIRRAMNTIKYWINLVDFHDLESDTIPEDLLVEVINKISHRKRLGLDESISLANWVLLNKQALITSKKKMLQDILIALEYLLIDTKLPDENERLNQEQNLFGIESIKQLPDLKAKSSKLAKLLYDFYKGERKEVPGIIIKWKKESLKSNLPELKKIWEADI